MDRRPLDVVFIVIYYAGFSAVLVGILAWQILAGHIHASWQEKAVVLPFTFLLALLPGVLSLGLWVLDNAARLGGILFALLHAIAEIAFLGKPHIPWPAFTVFRIAMDAVIIVCLCRPAVRGAFKWQPIRFSLRGGGM